MDNIIQLSNVTKSFKENDSVNILEGVQWSVPEGQIVSIMGPSGNGKTTLLKILTGQEAFEGQVNILGSPLQSGETLASYQDVGVSMDELGLYQYFSAKENLVFFSKLFGVPKQRGLDMLVLFGLDKDKNKKVKKFSKGMKQRLSLAVAMLKEPKLLVLDEPHNGLDEHNRSLVNNLLLKLKAQGTTVVLTTHSQEDAQIVSDQIYYLSKGKLTLQEA